MKLMGVKMSSEEAFEGVLSDTIYTGVLSTAHSRLYSCTPGVEAYRALKVLI